MGDKGAVSDRICKSDDAKRIFSWSVQKEKLNIRKTNASPETPSCFPADLSMKQNTDSTLFNFFLFSSMTHYRDHQDSMRCCSINNLNLLY